MPSTQLSADFRCGEGWEVRGLRWTGVPVAHLVELAGPLKEALYVAVDSGEFVALLTPSEIGPAQPLVANLLDGAPLPWEHGGPLRFVLERGHAIRASSGSSG